VGARYQNLRAPNSVSVVRSSRWRASSASGTGCRAPDRHRSSLQEVGDLALRALSAASRAFCWATFNSAKASSMRLLGVSLGHADLLRDELRKVSAVARVDLRVAQIGDEAARDRLGQIGAGRLRLSPPNAPFALTAKWGGQ
jgi:hypothetical protein